jgi:hypothetical protein
MCAREWCVIRLPPSPKTSSVSLSSVWRPDLCPGGIIPHVLLLSHTQPLSRLHTQVRGAYLNLEWRRAEQRGYPRPIWDTLQQTHDNFDACVADVLDEVGAWVG